MNVVVGVCGLGFGHCIRQSPIISELTRRGHKLALFGYLNSIRFFEERFPELSRFEVRRAWMPPSADGIDLSAVASDPRNVFSDAYALNFAAMHHVISMFGGPPDVVISDYCPVAAQLAYVTCRPLITIDNQSKFMGYDFPALDGWTRNQERCRLNLFFPKAASRIAVSTFSVNWPRDPAFQVIISPPLLRPEIQQYSWRDSDSDSRDIVVYLSRYPAVAHDRPPLDNFVSLFQRFPEFRFYIYSAAEVPATCGNVTIAPFCAASFTERFVRADGIITTPGDGILAEAMHVRKPVLAVPMPTYEQRFNAFEIEHHRCGLSSTAAVTDRTLCQFLQRLETFKDNIARCIEARDKFIEGDGFAFIMERLQNDHGL